MQFSVRKHRSPPAVIIISLIDVLLVVLIFLMVTTAAKQQNSVKLVLPESKQAKPGVTENALVVTVSKQGVFSLGKEENAVTPDQLVERLAAEVQKNPATTLSIRADTDAPFGRIFKVMDAAKAANIKVVSAFTKSGTAQ